MGIQISVTYGFIAYRFIQSYLRAAASPVLRFGAQPLDFGT